MPVHVHRDLDGDVTELGLNVLWVRAGRDQKAGVGMPELVGATVA